MCTEFNPNMFTFQIYQRILPKQVTMANIQIEGSKKVNSEVKISDENLYWRIMVLRFTPILNPRQNGKCGGGSGICIASSSLDPSVPMRNKDGLGCMQAEVTQNIKRTNRCYSVPVSIIGSSME